MIDEFQDIDEPQYRLMNVLCGWHKNLFVVGDPDGTVEQRYPTMAKCVEAGITAQAELRPRLLFWTCEER